MKKTDIALIIIIVSISAGLSYWVASATLGKSNDEPIVVRTVKEIKAGDDLKVDERVFSKDAINPTVEAVLKGEDLTSFIDDDKNADNTTSPSDNSTLDTTNSANDSQTNEAQ